MPRFARLGTLTALTVGALTAASAVAGATTPAWHAGPPAGSEFHQTNLVADNNSGLSTLYAIPPGGTTITKAALVVTVQGGRTSTNDGSSPTGQVFNSTAGFVVTGTAGSGPARFIFDSESGQIQAWSPTADPTNALAVISSPTAVYKGLAIAASDQGTFLSGSRRSTGCCT